MLDVVYDSITEAEFKDAQIQVRRSIRTHYRDQYPAADSGIRFGNPCEQRNVSTLSPPFVINNY